MTEAFKERPMPTGEGLTFEKVWAMYQETDRKFQETDRKFQETDRKFHKNWDRLNKEANERWKKEAAERAAERKKEAAERKKEAAERKKEAAERKKEAADRKREAAERKKEAAERYKEIERMIKEVTEAQREVSEDWKRVERIVENTSKQIGGIGNDLGALAEGMVGTTIAKRFNELDYHFDLVGTKGCKVTDKDGKIKTQVDVLMENGETVIAVEVKLKPLEKHIEHHIKQLKILKENWISILKRDKKFLGGIAGAIWDKTVKDAVHNAGLFVIEQSGDTMIIDMPEGWKPVEF
jgi:transducin (beta)-like 1/penicillin-binding protein 2A